MGVACLLSCLCCASRIWADDEPRTLTDLEGRTIEASVLGFDAEKRVVTLQRADGKTGRMLLDRFSEADQVYIGDWSALNDFMNKLSIAPQLETAEVSAESTQNGDVSKMIIDSSYTVRITNRSLTSFGKVTAEYCIFYRQGERDGPTINYDEGICYGKETWASLLPSATSSLKTKSVRLYSEGGNSTIFGRAEFSDANVRGIWLQLKTKLPSGKEVIREYRTADEPIWKWVPRSLGVGMNPSDSPYQMILLK